MELLVCWRLLLRRDVDHVRPGRDSSHNTPSSVPTARSTAMGEGSIALTERPQAIGAPEHDLDFQAAHPHGL